MTLGNKRTSFGLKASLLAPVLAVGMMVAAPTTASADSRTKADLNGSAALQTHGLAGRNGVRRGGHRGARHAGRRGRNVGRGYRAKRGYQHRRKARRRSRRNSAIGLGIGILGAAIIANRHYDRRPAHAAPRRSYRDGYRAAKRKCARVYGEDYVWRSDLVYDAYGDARVCKFVRRAGY